jgi:hypothetical protein
MNAHRLIVAVVTARVCQLETRLMDFSEIWYGHYAFGGHLKLLLADFIKSVIMWWTSKLSR